MFTGIIESVGQIKNIQQEGTNLNFVIESHLGAELKIDQSVSHNGVCLTVVGLEGQQHTVTAVEETLLKSNLGGLKIGDAINLERSMLLNGRLDGHLVQGHVDQMATCIKIEDKNGSWLMEFEYDPISQNITVEKGSICVNGVSLTVVNSMKDRFSVAIIPYTFYHTNFSSLKTGDFVNLEFDILGKYVQKYLSLLKA